MKKITATFALFLMAFLLTSVVALGDDNAFKLKDKMQSLGYSVTWNDEKKTIILQKDMDRIVIPVGANKCDVNGSWFYLKEPVFIKDGVSYVPQSVLKNIFRIGVLDDNGITHDALNPESVAFAFANDLLGFKGVAKLTEDKPTEFARVEFTRTDGTSIHIDLYQPTKKGVGGIWKVSHWFDINHKQYQARDLSKLQPLFHDVTDVPNNIIEPLRKRIVDQWTEAFSAYYKVLGFEAMGVDYKEVYESNHQIEIKFNLTMVTQNYYKDPDTVPYIKEAKEKNLKSYSTYYDEYNIAKTANSDLKITARLTSSGELEMASVKIFSGIFSPDEEYVEENMDGYFLGDRKAGDTNVLKNYLVGNILIGMNQDDVKVRTGVKPVSVVSEMTDEKVLRYDILKTSDYRFSGEESKYDSLDLEGMHAGKLSLVLFVHLDDNNLVKGFSIYNYDKATGKIYETRNGSETKAISS